MTTPQVHPSQALYQNQKPLPIIPVCEHIAGNEKLIKKSFQLQQELGAIFDITCDCEDGAQAGKEAEHAEMIARLIASDENKYDRVGVRIHDYKHFHWQKDIDILIPAIGNKLAYITLPKVSKAKHVKKIIKYIRKVAKENSIQKDMPIHVLIENHGALKNVWEIAKIKSVTVLDFGQMDFVSEHYGAISSDNLRSPGQFEHPLLIRAKSEIVAAALANGVVPSHNVTLDLKDPEQAYADALCAHKEFGFLRMWSIYPTQIKAIIDAMKPDYSEVSAAENILMAAQENHWGPIQYQGELYDRASYRYYWQLLQRAQIAGIELQSETNSRFFS